MKKLSAFLIIVSYSISIFANTTIEPQSFSLFFNADQNDYVKVSKPDFIDFLHEDFSVETIFNITKFTEKNATILHFYNENENLGFIEYIRGDGKLVFLLNRTEYIVNEFIFKKGECYHVSITKSGTKLIIYINGNLVLSERCDERFFSVKETPFYIGGNKDRDNFFGEIDEVRLFKKALNEREVNENLLQELTTINERLLAYFKFNDEDSQIVRDFSLYENRGCLGETEEGIEYDPERIKQQCIIKQNNINESSYFDGAITQNIRFINQCTNHEHLDVDNEGNDFHLDEYNIYDNHGNIYCESTINSQQQRQMMTNQVENVGNHFKIRYNDSSLTSEYIDVVKDVLLNLESLLNFSGMCNNSRTTIKLSTDNLGNRLAGNNYFFSGTPSDIIYGSLWRSINIGSHIGSFNYDAQIIFNQNKLNEFYTGNASNNTDVPNDKYYFYAIVQHQLIHAMGFDSFLKWDPQYITSVTKFDTLLKNNNDYILNSTPSSWTYNISDFVVSCGNTISTTTEIPLYTTNNTVLDNNYGMCHIHTNEPYLNSCGNGAETNKLMALKLTKGRYVELSSNEIDVLHSIGYNSNLLAFDFPDCGSLFPPIIDRCDTFTLNINEITNNVNARFNQFFIFNDGVNVTMSNENLVISSDFARYSLKIGYNLIDNNNNISNVGFMYLKFKVCDSHSTSFGCNVQANDCELICNGDMVEELIDSNYLNYQTLIGYPEMISGFYSFNGSPDYNRFNTSINTFSLYEQEGVMAKVNEITTNKKYMLTFKANKRQSNINTNLRIFLTNLTNTNYPSPSIYWTNVYENQFNSTNSQNIEPQITINNTLLENYLYCFEANNDFDVLVFSGKGSQNFLQIGEFDLVEDKMFDNNYFKTTYDINCNINIIGNQLCDVPNMKYSWFDVTNSIEVQLTDGLNILPDGDALGVVITTSNTNGSSIEINNIDTDKTFEIRKIFDNNVNVTCNDDRVAVNIHVTTNPTINFTYESHQFCTDDNNPLPNSISHTGGVFTINNGGVIDALTGEIDLLSSGFGIDNTGGFEIMYTTVCSSTSIQIQILTCNSNGFPISLDNWDGGSLTIFKAHNNGEIITKCFDCRLGLTKIDNQANETEILPQSSITGIKRQAYSWFPKNKNYFFFKDNHSTSTVTKYNINGSMAWQITSDYPVLDAMFFDNLNEVLYLKIGTVYSPNNIYLNGSLITTILNGGLLKININGNILGMIDNSNLLYDFEFFEKMYLNYNEVSNDFYFHEKQNNGHVRIFKYNVLNNTSTTLYDDSIYNIIGNLNTWPHGEYFINNETKKLYLINSTGNVYMKNLITGNYNFTTPLITLPFGYDNKYYINSDNNSNYIYVNINNSINKSTIIKYDDDFNLIWNFETLNGVLSISGVTSNQYSTFFTGSVLNSVQLNTDTSIINNHSLGSIYILKITEDIFGNPQPRRSQYNNTKLIYPNPFNNTFTIDLSNKTKDEYKIEIHTQYGEKISSFKMNAEKKEVNLLNNLIKGVLLIETTNSLGDSEYFKIIKK